MKNCSILNCFCIVICMVSLVGWREWTIVPGSHALSDTKSNNNERWKATDLSVDCKLWVSYLTWSEFVYNSGCLSKFMNTSFSKQLQHVLKSTQNFRAVCRITWKKMAAPSFTFWWNKLVSATSVDLSQRCFASPTSTSANRIQVYCHAEIRTDSHETQWSSRCSQSYIHEHSPV